MRITLTEKRFFKWCEDEIAVTLRNRSGSYGGGSEVLVIEDTDNSDGSRGGVMAWNTEGIVGTLRAQMDGHPPVVVTDGSDRDDSRPSDP